MSTQSDVPASDIRRSTDEIFPPARQPRRSVPAAIAAVVAVVAAAAVFLVMQM